MFRFDPFSPATCADPFPAYRTLRDEYPCFWSEEAQMWVLSRHADLPAFRHLENYRDLHRANMNRAFTEFETQ